MTYFIKRGNVYNVADSKALDIYDELPAGNYVVQFDQMKSEFFLEGIEAFIMPPKIYGKANGYCERIMNTFKDRNGATGVLLSGEKGSGKTLLTKSLSVNLAKEGVPTLVINSPWCGDIFNKFIQSILQPCIVLFDEFEKIFDDEDQQKVLTLLDGVFPSKKLFLLTINDGFIDSHMRNRPGRLFYSIRYKGLDSEFVREFAEDQLHNKDHIEKLVQIADCFSAFNFDMLKCVVEDMNRYKESPADVMKVLNARLEYDSNRIPYMVDIFEGDTKLPLNSYQPHRLNMSPLTVDDKPHINIYRYKNKKTKEAVYSEDAEDDDDVAYTALDAVPLNDSNLVTLMKGGTMIYMVTTGGITFQVRLSRRSEESNFNWDAF